MQSASLKIWVYGLPMLALLSLLALMSGSSAISSADLSAIFMSRWSPSTLLSLEQEHKEAILWSIRMPRIVMAGLCGAGLSLVGASIQALVRNPMADPWLLGVSSGASLGAVIAIVSGIASYGFPSIQVLAFLGALLAAGIIYFLARRGSNFSSTRLVFTGLAISFCLEALTQIVIYTAQQQSKVQNIMFWTLGSLGAVEGSDLALPTLAVGLGFGLLYRARDRLNIACLSEVKAYSLGLDLPAFRRYLFVLAAAVTAVLVSITGAIGFVGLMVPHVLRLILGNDYRLLIPGCFLGGACFMIAADALARSLFAPQEIPIGVITALLGSPIFIWLLRGARD